MLIKEIHFTGHDHPTEYPIVAPYVYTTGMDTGENGPTMLSHVAGMPAEAIGPPMPREPQGTPRRRASDRMELVDSDGVVIGEYWT